MAHFAESLIPKSTSGVCCFSESHSHQALWAYYANCYKGFCIQYHLETLISLIGFCWGHGAFPVNYSEDRTISSMEILNTDNVTPAARSFTTKHPDWAHEKEWRLVQQEKSGKFYHTPNAISGIILGPRIAPVYEAQLVEICRYKGIPYSKARFEEHRLILGPPTTHDQVRRPTPCDLSEDAKRTHAALIDKGLDQESLDAALQNLRLQSGAKAIAYLIFDEDENCLTAILEVILANGHDAAKSASFEINDNMVSPIYEYNY